jgi:hypothetical protein
MRKIVIAIIVLFIGSAMNSPKTGKDVIKIMHEKYAGKFCVTKQQKFIKTIP